MELKPIKNSVLCRRICDGKVTETTDDGLICRHEEVDIFRIIDFAADEDKNFPFKAGDDIIVNSTGDELDIDGEKFHLFKVDHVMARVL